MIGYALCASFCTHKKSLEILSRLAEKYDIIPIISENAYSTDTRFGTAKDFCGRVESVTGRKIIRSIKEAEPLGPASPLEMLIISPCTGNTLAKLANAVTDTSVTMAAKAHQRNGGKVLIALATNDAMSASLGNVAKMLSRKNVYFVPMIQDDPISKPSSLVADFDLIPECISLAAKGIQMRPLFK